MEEYKKYDEYKESGVKWIGEIPHKWEVIKLKKVSNILTGNTPSTSKRQYYEDGNIPWVKPANIREDYAISETDEKLTKKGLQESKGLIPPRSSIVCCIGTIGKVGFNRKKITTNQQINSVIFDDSMIVKKYGFYVVVASKEEHIRNSNKVVVAILNQTQQGRINIPIPSRFEQQKIAVFLDEKTEEIDKIINKKENLIEKLEEYKKSVITEAVTKGKLGDKYINEDGKLVDEIDMKDSGFEWLDKIPEYIAFINLKLIANIELGKMLQNEKLEGYYYKPYLKAKNVRWNNLDINEVEKMWFNKSEMEKYKLNKNDLLVCEGGEVGRSAIWENELEECYIQNSVHKVSFYENYISKFYLYYFQFLNAKDYFNSIVNQVSIAHLTKEKLINIPVIDTNYKVQNNIVNYLDMKTSQINKLIRKTKDSINKYKEFKKSLIFESVTGKIDLRDYDLKEGEDIAKHDNTREAEGESLSRAY